MMSIHAGATVRRFRVPEPQLAIFSSHANADKLISGERFLSDRKCDGVCPGIVDIEAYFLYTSGFASGIERKSGGAFTRGH